jgi:hypothetical protein
MKKHWLLFTCLIGCLFPLLAQERLAVFSVEKDTAGKLPCISIEFFNSVPAGELYGQIGPHFDPKYKAIGHMLFDEKARAELSPITGIGYFGMDNVVVLPHYRNFIAVAIGESKGQWTNNDSLYALQEKVWCYNVLDELGFIDRKAADQQSAFKKAREQFSFRYGLTNANPDNTMEKPMTILSKASQIYFTRKNTGNATEKPDIIRFTDSAIVYGQPLETHSIHAYYSGITSQELQSFSEALKDAIYLYIQDYRIPPERVDFSKLTNEPAGYILTLSAGMGGAGNVMSFKLDENGR